MSTLNVAAILRYRNSTVAAKWLCDAFGFRIETVHENPPGEVDHISLRYGAGVVLICPASGSALEEVPIEQDRDGEQQTVSCYMTVENIEAHCARATSLGAHVELPPQDTGGGARLYTCRDIEGHLWSFGTHGFGPELAPPEVLEPTTPPAGRRPGRGVSRALLILATLLGSAVTAGAFLLQDVNRDQIAMVIRGDSTPEVSSAEVGSSTGAQPIQVAASAERARETSTVQALRAEVAELRIAREGATAASKLITDRFNAATSALSEAETRLKMTEGELAALRRSEVASRIAASTAEAELAVVSKQLADSISSLDRERADNAEGAATLQQAVEQRDAARAEAERLAVSLDELRRSHQAVSDSAKAAEEKYRAELSIKESQVAAVSKQLADSTSSLDRERADNAEGAATLQQAVEQRDAARAEAERLAVSLDELRRSHQAVSDSAKAAEEKYRAELSIKESQVAAVSKQLADSTSSLDRERADKAESGATWQQAVEQRDAARVEAERLAVKLDELRRSHQATLDSAKAAEEKYRTELSIKESQVAAVSNRLAEIDDKKKSFAVAEQQLQTARAEAAASIAVLADVKSRHRLELAEKDKLIATLSTQLDLAQKRSKDRKEKMPVEKPKKSVPVEKPQKSVPVAEASIDAGSITGASVAGATLDTRCARAVCDQLLKRHGKSAQWIQAAANQACEGVADSTEPARCLQLVLGGKVSYGIGRSWKTRNALSLCGRTRNARETIRCFSERVGAKESWQSAVEACGG